MAIKLIAAVDEKFAIGLNGNLPWPRNKQDLAYFKSMTEGNIVIVGRTTYNSIPVPLNDRYVIVLSRDTNFTTLKEGEVGVIVRSIAEAYHAIHNTPGYEDKDAWVAGGADIYSGFILYAEEVVLTIIDGVYEADTHFPYQKLCSYIVLENDNTKQYGQCTYFNINVRPIPPLPCKEPAIENNHDHLDKSYIN